MATECDTLSVYFTNERGYRWYAGRYNQDTGKSDQEVKATRYYGSPVCKQAQAEKVAREIQSTTPYVVDVVVTPYWYSGFAMGEIVHLHTCFMQYQI